MRVEKEFKITGWYETSCVNAPYRKQKPNVPKLNEGDIHGLIKTLGDAGVDIDKSKSQVRFRVAVHGGTNIVEMGLEEKLTGALNSSSEPTGFLFTGQDFEIHFERYHNSSSRGGYGGTTYHEEGITVRVVYSGPDYNGGNVLIQQVQRILNTFYQDRIRPELEDDEQLEFLLERTKKKKPKRQVRNKKPRGGIR